MCQVAYIWLARPLRGLSARRFAPFSTPPFGWLVSISARRARFVAPTHQARQGKTSTAEQAEMLKARAFQRPDAC